MNFAQIKDGDYTLATSLGGFTKGVSPLEMASGYAAVENDGLYREPTCVKSIVDSDENVVYTSSLTEKTVYKQDAARMMTDIMTSVMDSGTGRSAKLADMPCAGKTGTTNDHKDGWFCGFTRYYTTAVWVGCDYPKAISNLSGSTYPAQIWKAYMSAAHEGLSSLDFLPYAQLSDDFKISRSRKRKNTTRCAKKTRWKKTRRMTSRLPRASRKIIQRTEAPKMITSRTITTAMPVIRITIPNRNIVGTTIPEKAEETLIRRKMEKIPINRTIAEPRIIAVIPERVEIPVVETYNKHI